MRLFIITPYEADSSYREKRTIIEGITKTQEIEVMYGDITDMPSIEANQRNILARLEASDAYLADLSFERPSCYFELGYAQAMSKAGRLIASSGTPIHQLVNRESIEFYQDLAEYAELAKKLIQFFQRKMSEHVTAKRRR